MPRTDFRSPRLYVDAPLSAGGQVPLTRSQGHYLKDVLRLTEGAAILVFNGHDGEWRGTLAPGKRAEALTLVEQTRPQDGLPDLRYVFAPLKHARLDYMVQKAVEMGAAALLPVVTRHTQVTRVNSERMRANVVEAAEQCGILSLATVGDPMSLERFLTTRDAARLLVFCDEEANITDPVQALAAAGDAAAQGIDVLIGPEGGFAPDERAVLLAQRTVARLALGPRILRADTAAVAALALVQSVLGDWR